MTTFVCPHFDVRIGNKEKELDSLFSKVSDKRRQNSAMFRFTHTRMKLFKGRVGKEEVDEESILEGILRKRSGNHVTIIVGNTGTGKSEMCSLIDIQLNEMGEKALYLGKSSDLVHIITEDIPGFYKECTGKDIPSAGALKDFNSWSQKPSIAAQFGALGLIMDFNLGSQFESNRRTMDKFMDYVTRKLSNILFKQSTIDSDIFDEVDLSSTQHRDWADSFVGVREKSSLSELATEMNEKFWSTLYKKMHAPDLTALFHQLQQDAPQERLFIIFEDYAFSRYETLKLLNFLEGDNPNNKCEVIIAGTQEKVLPSISQTALERFDFFRTQDKEVVPFLTGENAIDFIAPFLHYPKMLDGSIPLVDRKPSPSSPLDKSACSKCEMRVHCRPEDRVLYPFNGPFIQKIFDGLSEKKPRQFVTNVWNALYYHSKSRKPIAGAPVLKEERNTDYDYLDEVKDEDVRDFVAWYGIREQGKFSLPPNIAEIQGIDIDGLNGLGLPESGGNGEKEPPEGIKIVELPPDLKGYLEYVQNWKSDPLNAKWMDTNTYILEGVAHAIQKMTDDFSVKDGGSVRIKYKMGESPVVVEGEQAEADQIVINPKEIRLDQAKLLLKLGYFQERDKRKFGIKDAMEGCADIFAAWGDKWRSRLLTYVNGISLKSTDGPVPLEEVALASYGLLIFFADPWTPIDAVTIHTKYGTVKKLQVKNNFKTTLPPEVWSNLSYMYTFQNDLRLWVHYHYGLEEDLLDKNRIAKDFDFETSLRRVQTLDPKDVNKIGKKSVKVNGETYAGPVTITIGDQEIKELVTKLKSLTGFFLLPSGPTVREIDKIDRKEIQDFLLAYDGVTAAELYKDCSNLKKAIISSGINRRLMDEIIAISNRKTDYEAVVAGLRHLSELGSMEFSHCSKVVAWCMWQSLRDIENLNQSYMKLKEFQNMLEQHSESSSEYNKELESLRSTLNLFRGD